MTLWNYPENVTGFATLMDYMNYSTDNYFGLLLLIAIFVVLFVSMKFYETDKALAGASFVTLIIAVLFRSLNIIGDIVLFALVILVIVSVVYIFLERRGT